MNMIGRIQAAHKIEQWSPSKTHRNQNRREHTNIRTKPTTTTTAKTNSGIRTEWKKKNTCRTARCTYTRESHRQKKRKPTNLPMHTLGFYLSLSDSFALVSGQGRISLAAILFGRSQLRRVYVFNFECEKKTHIEFKNLASLAANERTNEMKWMFFSIGSKCRRVWLHGMRRCVYLSVIPIAFIDYIFSVLCTEWVHFTVRSIDI